MILTDLTVVVFCNKNDLYLTRICVASIRYFYPEVPVVLVKDFMNGNFSTKEIERIYNVKIYELGIRKFGWAAAKTFFLLRAPTGKRYIILDSDIVFTDPFLERVNSKLENADIVVSADYLEDPAEDWVKSIYFDIKKVKAYDPAYQYPGYFFNTGQLFIKGGAISAEQIGDLFSDRFPYWKKQDVFPVVDQSAYNYLFPKLQQEKKLRLAEDSFMIWSESSTAKIISLKTIIDGNFNGGLIHWAGAKRTPVLKKMSKSDILLFFQKEYYRKISFGRFKLLYRTGFFFLDSFIIRAKKKLHKNLKKFTSK